MPRLKCTAKYWSTAIWRWGVVWQIWEDEAGKPKGCGSRFLYPQRAPESTTFAVSVWWLNSDMFPPPHFTSCTQSIGSVVCCVQVQVVNFSAFFLTDRLARRWWGLHAQPSTVGASLPLRTFLPTRWSSSMLGRSFAPWSPMRGRGVMRAWALEAATYSGWTQSLWLTLLREGAWQGSSTTVAMWVEDGVGQIGGTPGGHTREDAWHPLL